MLGGIFAQKFKTSMPTVAGQIDIVGVQARGDKITPDDVIGICNHRFIGQKLFQRIIPAHY